MPIVKVPRTAPFGGAAAVLPAATSAAAPAASIASFTVSSSSSPPSGMRLELLPRVSKCRRTLRGRRDRHEAFRVARQQVDARQAGPLAVRLEQLCRLPALDPAAAHRSQQLHEPEVSFEAALETAQSFE